MDNTKELTHISLCAGYGGIDLGLRGALKAVRTIAFSEIEAFACANLVAKIEAGLLDAAPIWTDLKTFPWSAFHGRVDILSGGFPCQPFSSAGRRRGDDDPRHLWPHITRGIRELGHPPLVFFENVEGIISSRLTGNEWSDPAETPVLLHVLRELERLGYSATAGVFSAREVGLPHQRKRVFILGVRCDLTQDQREWVHSLLRAGGHNVANAQSDRDKRDTRTMGEKERTPLCEKHGAIVNGGSEARTAPPAPRGAEQYEWEPPRVTMGHANGRRGGSHGGECRVLPKTREQGEADRPKRASDAHAPKVAEQHGRQAKPTMGRDAHGVARGVDYAELCHSMDNRTDELRLLGNGVVPATAERAFGILWRRLADSACVTESRRARLDRAKIAR